MAGVSDNLADAGHLAVRAWCESRAFRRRPTTAVSLAQLIHQAVDVRVDRAAHCVLAVSRHDLARTLLEGDRRPVVGYDASRDIADVRVRTRPDGEWSLMGRPAVEHPQLDATFGGEPPGR